MRLRPHQLSLHPAPCRYQYDVIRSHRDTNMASSGPIPAPIWRHSVPPRHLYGIMRSHAGTHITSHRWITFVFNNIIFLTIDAFNRRHLMYLTFRYFRYIRYTRYIFRYILIRNTFLRNQKINERTESLTALGH